MRSASAASSSAISGLTSFAFFVAVLVPAVRTGGATRGLTGGLGRVEEELAAAFGLVGGGLGTRGLTAFFTPADAADGFVDPDAAFGFGGGFGGITKTGKERMEEEVQDDIEEKRLMANNSSYVMKSELSGGHHRFTPSYPPSPLI
jgi:hypothetical protein